MGLSRTDVALLAEFERRFQSIAKDEKPEDQADLLEFDVLLRDRVFYKPIPPARRVRVRRSKFMPKFV